MTDREKIALAFRMLRKNGITARMNFLCCGGCGHSEMHDRLGDGRPYVFYHAQEHSRFKRGEMLPNDGIWLQWSGSIEVARAICVALSTAGLRAAMPRDEGQAIKVEGVH
jgi:hypothetical protein